MPHDLATPTMIKLLYMYVCVCVFMYVCALKLSVSSLITNAIETCGSRLQFLIE